MPTLSQVRLSTGEPYAGELHVRFGGKGVRLNRTSLPLSRVHVDKPVSGPRRIAKPVDSVFVGAVVRSLTAAGDPMPVKASDAIVGEVKESLPGVVTPDQLRTSLRSKGRLSAHERTAARTRQIAVD